jgi:hypothetical protein
MRRREGRLGLRRIGNGKAEGLPAGEKAGPIAWSISLTPQVPGCC